MPAINSTGSRAWFTTTPGIVGILLGIAVGTVGVKTGFGPLRISILLTLLAFALATVTAGRDRVLGYRPCRLEYFAAIFIVSLICLELYNAIDLRHPARFDTIIQWTVYALGFVAARLVIANETNKIAYLRGLVALAPVAALIGVFQLLEFHPVADFVLHVTESSGALGRLERNATTRATGLIGHWTGFGGYLLVMALTYLMLHGRLAKSGSNRGLQLTVTMSVLALGVLSTLTLSVIISFAVVVLVYLWAAKRLGTIAFYLISAGFVGLSVFGAVLETRLQEQFGYNPGALAETNGLLPETLAYRLEIWGRQTIPAILQRPITGWGQGFYSEFGQWHNFPSFVTWPSSESQWFLILINSGIVGLILFLLPLAELLHKMRQQNGPVRATLLTFAFVSFITSLTVPLFSNAGLPAAFVSLAAVLYAGRGNVMDPHLLPPSFTTEREDKTTVSPRFSV